MIPSVGSFLELFFSAFVMMCSAGQVFSRLVLMMVFGGWAHVYNQAHQVGSTFWAHVSARQMLVVSSGAPLTRTLASKL